MTVAPASGNTAPGERKRERSDEEEERSMDPGPEEWKPDTKLLANVGEGNCLWHALTQHANLRAQPQGKSMKSHRQLRQYRVHVMEN